MAQVRDQQAFAGLQSLLEHGIADRVTQLLHPGAGGRRGPDEALLPGEARKMRRVQSGREIRLVHDDDGGLPPRQIQQPPVFIAQRLAPIEHRQDQFGARQRVVRAAHALAFHHVHGLPQARRVQQADGNTAHVDELLQHVACRAWDRGHNRPIRLRQRIHEAGLAHIGTSDQNGRDAFANDASFLRRPDELPNPIPGCKDALGQVLRGNECDAFVREVDAGFDFNQQAYQAFAQTPELLRKGSAELFQCDPETGLGTGRNQVHHGLGLCEIEPAVQKGTLGELPRLRQSRAAQEKGLQTEPKDEWPPVALELDDVLAGVAAGCLHDGRQDFVYARAVGRAQFAMVQGVRRVVTDSPAAGAGKNPRGDV